MRKIHLMNKDNRDAQVAITSLKYEKPYEMGLPNKQLKFKRYLSATEGNLHKNLASVHGDNYASKLIEEDPEIDIEAIGKFISSSDVVYLSNKSEILYAPPKTVEVIIAPDGSEKERRDPKNIPGNVDDVVLLGNLLDDCVDIFSNEMFSYSLLFLGALCSGEDGGVAEPSERSLPPREGRR